MFLEYLERIRAKSPEARRRFAVTWSSISTFLIVLVWLSVLFGSSYVEDKMPPDGSDASLFDQERQQTPSLFDSANEFLDTARPVTAPPASDTRSVIAPVSSSTVFDMTQSSSTGSVEPTSPNTETPTPANPDKEQIEVSATTTIPLWP